MKPLISYILPLLLLILSFSHRSFALDDNQDSTSYEAHFLSIQEYCQCLMAVASAEDVHGLYNTETMSGEILQTASPEDQQPHLLYSIARSLDPQTPMIGLTELDAMRCCNWIETSLPSRDNTLPSTEVGSYILHEDGSFEVNNTAQLHLLQHDDGTFEIISSVKNATSPLMMFGGERGNEEKGKIVRTFPDVGDQTAANRKQYDSVGCQEGSSLQQNPRAPAMNITVESLANILHNDNFDDASLIGSYQQSEQSTHNGDYVAINDKLWCLPEVIKACFRSQEDRNMMAEARLKIRSNLEEGMKKSENYKENVPTGVTRMIRRSGRTNQTKITEDLKKFDQFFVNHTLTRGNLAQFCNTHSITVPALPTGRIAKVSEGGNPSFYGTIQELGNNAAEVFHHLTEGQENETTRLTAPIRAPRQATVFNEDHVIEIHTLIARTRSELTPESTLQDAFNLFDSKAAATNCLTLMAKKLLLKIRGASDLNNPTRYKNWVYESLNPKVKSISLTDAVRLVQANLAQTQAIADRSEDLAGNAHSFASMAKQLAQKKALLWELR